MRIIPPLAFLLAMTRLGGAPAYQVGENLLKNPNLTFAEGGVEHWRWSMPQGRATLREDDGAARIVFAPDAVGQQCRIIQSGVAVQPRRVYELTYTYRSGMDSRLHADVLLTGFEPVGRLRHFYASPAEQWTTVRHFLTTPDRDEPRVGVFLQNRSAIPIWYREVALRETDIPPEKLPDHQLAIAIHPVTGDDELIMPGEPDRNLHYLLSTPIAELARQGISIKAKLFSENLVTPAIIEGDRLVLPSAAVPPGTSFLHVQLFDQEGVGIARRQIKIERLAPEQIQAVHIDEPATLRDHNGDPFFPIGMFGLNYLHRRSATEQERIFGQLREAGFNTLHTYAFEGNVHREYHYEPIRERMEQYLERANRHGMKTLMGLPRHWVEHRNEAALANWLVTFRETPDVLFYYSDEMLLKGYTSSSFAMIRNLIRTHDPNRVWVDYDRPSPDLAPYVGGGFHSYTNPAKFRLFHAFHGNQPIIHCFGQADVGVPSPELEDIRFQVFMPVILGARGIFYWQLVNVLARSQEPERLQERLYGSTRLLAQAIPSILANRKTAALPTAIETAGGMRILAASPDDSLAHVLAGVPRREPSGTLHLTLPQGYVARSLFPESRIRTGDRSLNLELAAGTVALIAIERQADR